MTRTIRCGILTAGCLLVLAIGPAYAQGTFTGKVVVEWVTGQTPERDMRLVEQFTFTDAKGKAWTVPAGTVVNGASIPRAFWTAVGSPYTGNYRRASVVHDYYCVQRSERWEDVHRMFFYAMIAGGVGEIEAKILYAAVYAGGPRWTTTMSRNLEGKLEKRTVMQTASVSADVQDRTTAWIRGANPSLESIEQTLAADVVVR